MLREEQIERYSRHVLLAPVGGLGQERLLSSGARSISAQAEALDAAEAYLAAAGVGVELQTSPSAAHAPVPGFFESGLDLASLSDLNPDAVPLRSGAGCLAVAPTSCQGAAPWVLLGTDLTDPCVLFRSEEGCADCFLSAAQRLTPPPCDARSVALGAMAALVWQRLALRLSEPLGTVVLGPESSFESRELPLCLHHKP